MTKKIEKKPARAKRTNEKRIKTLEEVVSQMAGLMQAQMRDINILKVQATKKKKSIIGKWFR